MDTSLSSALEQLKKEGYNPVREAKAYTFGSVKECKALFIEAFNLTDKTVKEYKHLPEYDEVIKWLSNTEGKGLALFGSIGRGKSVILTGVLPLIFTLAGLSLKSIPAINLRRDKNYINRWAYAVDDIGTEPLASDYGVRYEIIDEILNNAENTLKPLFFTSNLTSSQFTERYGERGYDRIKRLCKIVIFKGISLRK